MGFEDVSRKQQLLFLVIVLLLFLGLISVKYYQAEESESSEQVNPEQLLAKARQERKPVWVLFHSTTCASCQEMERIFWELEPQWKEKVAFVEVDVNLPSSAWLCEQYRVQYIPTSYLLDGEGKVVFSKVGVIAPAEMESRLQSLSGTR